MVELYSNIKSEVRDDAIHFWRTALALKDPRSAAKFLNNAIETYRQTHTEEEVDFIQFYFETQMEMNKND